MSLTKLNLTLRAGEAPYHMSAQPPARGSAPLSSAADTSLDSLHLAHAQDYYITQPQTTDSNSCMQPSP